MCIDNYEYNEEDASKRVHVSTIGEDSSGCGTEEYACETISYAVGEGIGGTSEGATYSVILENITIHRSESESIEINNSRVVNIYSSYGQALKLVSAINSEDGTSAVFMIGGNVSMSNITFELDRQTERILKHHLMSISGGSVSLSSIIIHPPAGAPLELTKSLISIRGSATVSASVDISRVGIYSSKGTAIHAELEGEGSLTITSSTFSQVYSPTGASTPNMAGEGGAIWVGCGGDSVFSIEDSTFATCTAGGCGGAIYLQAGDTWTTSETNMISITNCTFRMCHSDSGNGGALAILLGTHRALNVSSSSFISCYSDGGMGGAIYSELSSSSLLSLSDSVSFVNCSVVYSPPTDGNPANSYGGGVYVSAQEDSSLTVSTVSIDDCKAYCGGGIYLNLTGEPTELVFNTITYTSIGNKASAEALGNTFFMYTPARRYHSESQFSAFMSGDDRDEGAYAKIGEQDAVILASLFDRTNVFVSGDATVSEGEDCGFKDIPCKSIAQALQKITTNTQTIRLMESENNDKDTSTLSIGAKTVSITREGETTPTLKLKTGFTLTTGNLIQHDFSITVQYSGGALYLVTGTGSVSFDNMIVSSSSSSSFSSSPINSKKLTLTNSQFKSFTLTGCSLMTNPTTSLTMSNVTFESISTSGIGSVVSGYSGSIRNVTFTTCTSTSNSGGGAMSLTPSGTSEVSSCTFSGCTATNGNGGALYITISSSSSFPLTSTSFTNCKAKIGGAIYLYVSAKPTSLLFSGITFSGNTATQNSIGSYNTLYVSSLASYLSEGYFPSFITGLTTTDNQATTTSESSTVTLASLFGVTSYGHSLKVQSGTNAHNTNECYTGSDYCSSLPEAYNAHLHSPPGTYTRTLLVNYPDNYGDTELARTTPLLIRLNNYIPSVSQSLRDVNCNFALDSPRSSESVDWTVTIESESISSPTTLSIEAAPSIAIFDILSGSLTLKSFSISIAASLTSSLVSVATGSLSMSSMTIQSGTSYTHSTQSILSLTSTGTFIAKSSTTFSTLKLSNIPLISGTSASMTFSSVSFTSIIRSSGGGAVFMFGTTQKLPSFNSVTFTSCTSSSYGGAISVSLSTDITFDLTGVTFNRCTATNGGGAVYIYLTKGIVKLKSTQFKYSSISGQKNFVYIAYSDGYSLMEREEWSSLVGSPYLTAKANNNTQYWIHESTYISAPMLHFKYAPSEDSSVIEVYVDTSGKDYATCGWSDVPCKTIHAAYDHIGSIQSITLRSGSHTTETESTTFSSGTLTITAATGTTKSVTSPPSKGTFINTGATLTFTSISFSLVSLSTALFFADSGVLTLQHLSVTGTSTSTTSPLLLITGSATLTDCNFSTITYNGARNGACISATLSADDTLTISSSKFESISSISGLGGAMHIEASHPGSLSLSGLTFSACTSKSTGGNVYLFCDDATNMCTTEVFVNMFSSFDQSLWDMYWVKESIYTRKPYETSILSFFFSPKDVPSSEVYVSPEGSDSPTCGWESLPCKTIRKAMGQSDTSASEEQRMYLLSGMHASEEESIRIEGETSLCYSIHPPPSVPSVSKSVHPLTQSGVPLFTISSVSASFGDIFFIIHADAPRVMEIHSGHLSLERITLQSASSEAVSLSLSLIHIVSPGCVHLCECEFIKVRNRNGNGSALSGEIEEDESIRVGGDGEGTVGVTFRECEAVNGGAVYVRTNNGNSIKVSGGVMFKGCECEENGGGVYVLSESDDHPLIDSSSSSSSSSLSFYQCKASNGYGGGIYIKTRSFTSETFALPSSSCSFIECSDSQDTSGNGLFLSCSSIESFLSYTEWKRILGMEEDDAYNSSVDGVYTGESDAFVFAIQHLVFYPSAIIYITADNSVGEGVSVPTCGWCDIPCHSIGGANSHATVGDTIHVSAGTYNEEEAPITLVGGVIRGEDFNEDGELESIQKVGSSTLFIINVPILLQTICICGDGETLMQQSVIQATNGKLGLSGVIFKNIIMNNAPLLSIGVSVSDNLVMNGISNRKNQFIDITRSIGSGVIFQTTMGEKQYFTINQAAFTRCKSTARGDANAAISVTVTAKPSTFTMTDLDFTACTNKNIYITSTCDVLSFLHKDNFKGTQEEYDSATEAMYYVDDKTTYEDRVALPSTLIRYLYPPSKASLSTVYVAGKNNGKYGGVETDICGWEDIPCLSISSAITHCTSVSTVMMKAGTHDAEAAITLTSSLTLSGPSEATATKNVNSQLFIVGEHELTVERVTFVGGEDAIASSVIDASAGSLILKGVSFNRMKMENAPLLTINPSSFTMSDDCTFTSVTRETGSGSVFSLSVATDAEFSLSDTSFSSCPTAVYIQVNGKPTKFELKNLVFPTAAENSRNIFIESSVDVTSFINPTKQTSFSGTLTSYDVSLLSLYWVSDHRVDTSILTLLFPLISSSSSSSSSSSTQYSIPDTIVVDDSTGVIEIIGEIDIKDLSTVLRGRETSSSSSSSSSLSSSLRSREREHRLNIKMEREEGEEGEREERGVVSVEEGEGRIEDTDVVFMNDIPPPYSTFILLSSSSSSSSSSTSLTIIHSSFTSSSSDSYSYSSSSSSAISLSVSLIRFCSSRVHLEDVRFEKIILSCEPLFETCRYEFDEFDEFDECDDKNNNKSNDESDECGERGERGLRVKKCSFREIIQRSTERSAIVEVRRRGDVRVEECEFERVVGERREGEMVWIERSSVEMKKTRFNIISCSSFSNDEYTRQEEVWNENVRGGERVNTELSDTEYGCVWNHSAVMLKDVRGTIDECTFGNMNEGILSIEQDSLLTLKHVLVEADSLPS